MPQMAKCAPTQATKTSKDWTPMDLDHQVDPLWDGDGRLARIVLRFGSGLYVARCAPTQAGYKNVKGLTLPCIWTSVTTLGRGGRRLTTGSGRFGTIWPHVAQVLLLQKRKRIELLWIWTSGTNSGTAWWQHLVFTQTFRAPQPIKWR